MVVERVREKLGTGWIEVRAKKQSMLKKTVCFLQIKVAFIVFKFFTSRSINSPKGEFFCLTNKGVIWND